MLVHTGTSLDAKALSEVECGLEGVVISKYTLSQSHHWSLCPETPVNCHIIS